MLPSARSISRRPHIRNLASMLVVAAVAFTARASLADHYVVPSGSMQPTVQIGDHVVVNKLAYGLRVPLTELYVLDATGPARGDVVVLSSPEDGKVLLKRVVALPGDRVRVEDGTIEINGALVPIANDGGTVIESLGATSHALDLSSGGGPDFGPVTVPDSQYLVLGDARGNSNDGRYFGFVPKRAILGRAAAVVVRSGVPTLLGL